MYLTLRDRPANRPSAATDGSTGEAARGGARRSTVRRVSSTVMLLGVVSMFTDISTESVNAVLPLYLVFTVGLSPQAFGFVNGLYSGVSAAIRLLGGWLADRTDHPKWIACLGYVASALSRFGLIFATGLGPISAIITGDRLGKGLRTAPRDSVIAASTPPEALGRAYGVHRSLDSLGAAIGPLIAFCILSLVADDFHAVFVVSLAFAVIGVVTLLLFVPDVRPRRMRLSRVDMPATSSTEAAVAPLARVRLRHLADPALGRLVGAATLLQVLTVGDSFLYLQLQLRDQYASNYFALLMVGMNATYVVLAVPFGRLADRIGRTRVFVAGHVALALCYLCAAGPFRGPALSVGCLIALGAYYAATDGTLAALAARVTDPATRATGIATAQTCQALAGFVSSLLIGILWATYGLSDAILWCLPALVVALPIALRVLRGVDVVERAGAVGTPAAAL